MTTPRALVPAAARTSRAVTGARRAATATGLTAFRWLRGAVPFAIHPPMAIIVTWVRAAGASAPTVVVDAVYHSPALGGNHHLAAGDS